MPKKKKSKALKRLEKAVVKQEEVSEPELQEIDREATEDKTETEEGLGIEQEEKEEAGWPVEEEKNEDEEEE